MQNRCDLLHRAAHYQANRNWEGALKLAWSALEQAEGDWAVAARAHLILAEGALALGEPVDALNFTLGAQATALAAGDTTTQTTACQLQRTITERWGDWPAKELAADYERILTQPGAVHLTGDD